MTTTAEEALGALARDLAAELAAAQAVELAGPEAVEQLELAVFNVRSHRRTERVGGKEVTEQVRDYSAHRLPGQGLEHPGQSMLGEVEHFIQGDPSHMGHNISQPDWVAHEWKGHQAAQKAWQKAEPRVKGKPKSADQIADEVQTHTADKLPDRSEYKGAGAHLDKATDHLLRRDEQTGQLDQGHAASAYESLSKAHDHIREHVIPHAKPEDYPEIAQHLQRISGHMQDLDKAMGAKPESTRQLLGSYKENFAHAGEARRMGDLQKLEEGAAAAGQQADQARKGEAGPEDGVPNWLAPGRRIADPRVRGLEGKVAGVSARYGGRLDITWDDGVKGSYSLKDAAELLTPGKGEEKTPGFFPRPQPEAETGMEAAMAKAEAEAWVGKRVRVAGDMRNAPIGAKISGGGEGTVVSYPDKIFDYGAEHYAPNPGNYVEVVWDKDAYAAAMGKGASVPVEYLTESTGPDAPTGAAAVHPGMGGHLQRLPGETISQRAYSHVPQPFQVPPPNPDQARALKAEASAQHASEELAYQRGMQASVREERRNTAVLERMGLPAPGTYRPLTDEEYATHQKMVDGSVEQAVRNGLATNELYTENGDGYTWDPDRASLHHDMIKEFMDRQVDVPSQRHVVLVGGLPGAGKSSIFSDRISKDEYAVVSADDFKEEMAKRGMIPEIAGLSPMESSALVHEESKYLAAVAQHELQKRGKNVALEITMSRQKTVEKKIAAFEERGYHVTGVLVDIPAETSADRAENRYHTALEAYRRGDNPLGGRYILRADLLKAEASPGLTYPRQTFENLKGRFGSWERWDGTTPGGATLAEQSHAPALPGDGIPSAEALRKEQVAARSAQTRDFLQGLQQPFEEPSTPQAAPAEPALPWTEAGSVLSYQNSMGIDRKDMPQITGVGSDGKYHRSDETVPQFFDQLQSKGIPVTIERVPSASLLPTQTSGSADVTRSIAGDLASGKLTDSKPVLISSDNRVIDGHHTWSAHAMNAAAGKRTGVAPGVPVIRAGAPANRILQELQDFSSRNGFKKLAVGQSANPERQSAAAIALDTEAAAKAAEKGTAGT